MSVYLLILADSLPITSDNVAILGMYYMATIFLIGFSLVGTVVVLRCHFAESKPSTSLVKFAKFVLRRRDGKKTCNTVFVRSASLPEKEQTEEIEIKKTEDFSTERTLQLIANDIQEQKELNEWKDSWKEIGEATDRLLLVIFIVVTLITTIAIWLQRP